MIILLCIYYRNSYKYNQDVINTRDYKNNININIDNRDYCRGEIEI